MTGRIEIKHIFPDETDFVIFTIRKVSNLVTLVPATFFDGVTTLTNQTKFVYPAPHPESVMVLTDIDPTMYLVTAYRSSDGVSLDEQLDIQLAVDASTGAQFAVDKFEYVVNRGFNNTSPIPTGSEVWNDPVSGQNQLRDERLLNKDYWVVERGTSLLLTSEYTDRSDEGGGFDFTADGKNFEDGGVYFVIVKNRVDVLSTGPGSGGSDYNDIVPMPGDLTFDQATMTSKTIVSTYAGSNKVIILSIPNLSILSDTKFRIQAHGGTQRYIAVQLDVGDSVMVRGASLNVFYVAIGELVEVVVKNNVMHIISPMTGYEKLGQRIWGEIVDSVTLRRDGVQYQQDDVPRLMQFVSLLTNTVTEAQWATSALDPKTGETIYPWKGFFAVDNLAGTIRVPDDRGKTIRALKTDTGDSDRHTQGAGGYQHHRTSMKSVKVGIRNGVGGSSTGSISGTGFSGQDSYSNWITENGSTESHIRFNTPGGPGVGDGFEGTDENSTVNTGMIPLICI